MTSRAPAYSSRGRTVTGLDGTDAGELRQHYREGQEDQLGALGLVLNMIVLWNTLYMEAALNHLRAEQQGEAR